MDITTADRIVDWRNYKHPNRKARRERERKAIKNHAQELKDRHNRQRRARKKVQRRPHMISQHKDSRYSRLSDSVIKCIVWLYVAGAMILDYIKMPFIELMVPFSSNKAMKAARKSTSDSIIGKKAIPSTEDTPNDREFASEKEDIDMQSAVEKSAIKEIPETKLPGPTHSLPALSDTSDNATTIPSTPSLSSPRSSFSIDTFSGKSTKPPWYLQKFDEVNEQGLRKCVSNDHLERHVLARNDRDAMNQGSEEISCWWSGDDSGS